MHVTLDVFSGRPNPSWELSQEHRSEFLTKISNLKTKEHFQFDSSKYELGYSGIILEEADTTHKTKRFEIYNGIINVVENDSSYALEDTGYGIEKWVLQTAPDSIDELVKYIKQEIENRVAKS